MSRTREIIDAFGDRLRVRLETSDDGAALVALERPAHPGSPVVTLSRYGARILWGYLMTARLATSEGLVEDYAEGALPATFRLMIAPRSTVTIEQRGFAAPFEIAATFWDRLLAELCLVLAHADAIEERAALRIQ